MRSVLASLILSLAALPASAAVEIIGWVGIPLTQNVQVPDVVGSDLATADTSLEAVGLDTGTTTSTCSAQPADEVLSQNPTAGSFVALGSTVDLTYSSGVECTWDFSGIPTGWYTMPNVLAEQDFMREARVEANTNGVWAYWLPGAPQGSANLRLDLDIIRAEADGSAVWARWAPATTGRNSGNLQLNMVLALEANFGQ